MSGGRIAAREVGVGKTVRGMCAGVYERCLEKHEAEVLLLLHDPRPRDLKTKTTSIPCEMGWSRAEMRVTRQASRAGPGAARDTGPVDERREVGD